MTSSVLTPIQVSEPVRRRGHPGKKAPSTGDIDRTKWYPLDEFKRRTRFGTGAMKKVARSVPVVKIGGVGFVSGAAFAEFLDEQLEAQTGK